MARGAYLTFSSWSRLEAGTKIREGISYQSNSGHFVPIVSEVIVWLAGPAARDSGLASCKSDL